MGSPDKSLQILIRSIVTGKIAMYCCTGIEYHNSIWSTALMGDFGTGMDWWWDGGVHDYGYYKDLKPLTQNPPSLRSPARPIGGFCSALKVTTSPTGGMLQGYPMLFSMVGL